MIENITIDIQRPTGFDECHDCKAIGIIEKKLRAEALKTISEFDDHIGATILIHCQSKDLKNHKVIPMSTIKYDVKNGIHQVSESFGIEVCPGLTG